MLGVKSDQKKSTLQTALNNTVIIRHENKFTQTSDTSLNKSGVKKDNTCDKEQLKISRNYLAALGNIQFNSTIFNEFRAFAQNNALLNNENTISLLKFMLGILQEAENMQKKLDEYVKKIKLKTEKFQYFEKENSSNTVIGQDANQKTQFSETDSTKDEFLSKIESLTAENKLLKTQLKESKMSS
jgi:hypothetical protein